MSEVNILNNGDIEIIAGTESRASGTLTFSNGGGGVVSLVCTWSASANQSTNSSAVTATLRLTASAKGNCLSGSHLTINGNQKTYGQYINSHSVTTFTLCTHTVNVPHNSDGTKTITISGALRWDGYMWNNSGVNVSTLSGSGNVTLDKIATVPNPPRNQSISGRFEKYQSTTITFSGPASGPVTGYKIWYRIWYKDTNSYSNWVHHGNNTSGRYSISHTNIGGDAIQMGVSSVNGSYESSRVDTGWIYHQGVKVHNGSDFAYGQLKVWNGSSWVQGYARVWNGSSWVRVQ